MKLKKTLLTLTMALSVFAFASCNSQKTEEAQPAEPSTTQTSTPDEASKPVNGTTDDQNSTVDTNSNSAEKPSTNK